MRKIFLFVPVLCLIFSSCNFMGGKRVRGNGSITKEQRTVSAFDEVQASGSVDVYVVQGDLKPVQIEGDENLIPYIELQQTGGKLVITSKKGYNLDPSGDMKIWVTSPKFEKIQVSGACSIISDSKIKTDDDLRLSVSGAGDIRMDVDAPKIEADLSGAGKVDLKGQTKDFDLDLTGAGSAHCFDLLSENTKVQISGAGNAQVYASMKLDAQISGAGSLKYKGNASDVKQHVSGAGSVSKSD